MHGIALFYFTHPGDFSEGSNQFTFTTLVPVRTGSVCYYYYFLGGGELCIDEKLVDGLTEGRGILNASEYYDGYVWCEG